MDNDANTVDSDVSLEEFENQFFGRTPPAEKEEAPEEEVNENEDNSLAPDEDEDEGAEEEGDEDEDSDEEEIEEVPQLKQPKRNKTQERIEKLVADARQAERERDALRIEIERLRSESEAKQPKPVDKPREEVVSDSAPRPDAKGEDGELIYELGEFDPKFIADLTRHTIEKEMKAAQEKANKDAAEQAVLKQQQELTTAWNDKVTEYEKESPTIRKDILNLTETFANVEPSYGEFLASTIMGLDAGPAVMHYLSQNIDEAQKIVASGPVAATLALGRLEASLTVKEKRNKTPRVSKAAEPPAEQARGRHGRFSVAPDTDDLDAFERAFFS